MEDIVDRENKENENEESQTLNDAYDKVSSLGPPNVLDGYFSSMTNENNSELGEELGDIKVSDTVMDSEDFSSNSFEEDNQQELNTGQKEVKFSVKNVLDGSIFTKEFVAIVFPYIFFIGLLFVLYIFNRNVAESLIRENMVLRSQVRDLRAESIIIASELMSISKETEIATKISKKNLGIYSQSSPPLIFYIDKFERADSLKQDIFEPSEDDFEYPGGY